MSREPPFRMAEAESWIVLCGGLLYQTVSLAGLFFDQLLFPRLNMLLLLCTNSKFREITRQERLSLGLSN